MNVSSLPSLQRLRTYSAAQTSIVIANTQPITELRGQLNNLSSAQVNAILIALDGNGLLAGTVNLSGQTPIAPPTATGLAAAANLIGKGWTVTVDKPTWAPATEIGTWADSGGPAFGNLAAFQAGADMATVSQLTFAGTGNLTSLTGLQGLPVLATLDVNTNALTSLDVSTCTSLTDLYCFSNSLTSLDVTGCTVLTTLDCGSNALILLDISTCSALTYLDCNSNALTSLDVSTCTSLTDLYCFSNSLTSLDVTGCTVLTTLSCDSNTLTSLDISTCSALTHLGCTSNILTVLSVNTILTDLVTFGLQGGVVDLSTQTPAAPPSVGPPDGIAAVATLLGYASPWIVTTD